MVNDQGAGPLRFYASHGPIADLGPYEELAEDVPSDIPGLCQVIQGLLVHFGATQRLYGFAVPGDRKDERDLRYVAKLLERIHELDSRPLTVQRAPERRLMVNCRDYAVLACALLRHHGVPSRARSGFATYFKGPDSEPGFNVDHWVCEYWRAEEQRWVSFDAEVDPTVRDYNNIAIDTYDLPPGAFILAGEAWRLCRTGQADPDTFGWQDERGEWYIQDSLVHDFAALNKVEVLCWDGWAPADREAEDDLLPEDAVFLDHVAALSLAGNEAFNEVRTLYEIDARLRVPRVIKSYTRTGVKLVTLPELPEVGV